MAVLSHEQGGLTIGLRNMHDMFDSIDFTLCRDRPDQQAMGEEKRIQVFSNLNTSSRQNHNVIAHPFEIDDVM